MSLIVEFELQTPILRTASGAIRKIQLEEVYGTEAGEAKLLFWAFGDEFESFNAALDDDQSVAEYAVLDASPTQSLYSAVLTAWAEDRLTYPIAAEHDITILEIIVTDETLVRARMPSREALFSYRDQCLEKDIGVRIRRLYQEREPDSDQYGVTDRQQEALLSALEGGYFEVPRETTLGAVAAKLDISDQALSARLRRGQSNLLQQTLADEPL